MLDPGFWNDPEQAQQVTQKLAALKDRVAQYRELARVQEDLVVLLDLGEEEEDETVAREVAGELKKAGPAGGEDGAGGAAERPL